MLFVGTSFVENNNQDSIFSTFWVYDGDNIYKKNKKFKNNRSGYIFYEDGELIVRRNLNWCGNSGPSYSNLYGNWRILTDSTLAIKYKLWGYLNKSSIGFNFKENNEIEIHEFAIKNPKKILPKPFLGK